MDTLKFKMIKGSCFPEKFNNFPSKSTHVLEKRNEQNKTTTAITKTPSQQESIKFFTSSITNGGYKLNATFPFCKKIWESF